MIAFFYYKKSKITKSKRKNGPMWRIDEIHKNGCYK
jgi:hypothetical protein